MLGEAAGPRLGVHYDFGMQPHPHMAQHQRSAHKQPPLDWISAAGAAACLLHLAIRRLNAKMAAIGGANPTQGAMGDAPGGIPQGVSLVTTPVTPRVVQLPDVG